MTNEFTPEEQKTISRMMSIGLMLRLFGAAPYASNINEFEQSLYGDGYGPPLDFPAEVDRDVVYFAASTRTGDRVDYNVVRYDDSHLWDDDCYWREAKPDGVRPQMFFSLFWPIYTYDLCDDPPMGA